MSDNIHEVSVSIGRLEGKIDALIAQRAEERGELRALDDRLRSVENTKAMLMGISAAVGGGASTIVTIGLHLLSK